MKKSGDNKEEVNNSPKENDNNNHNKDQSNILLYFQYLSNKGNSPYENGGIKKKIKIEQLLSKIGPFILTTNIDILNLPFINYDLNENRFSEFLLFIINNPEINYSDNNIKQINKLFLESIKTGNSDISKIENIQGNIPWNLELLYKIFHKKIDSLDKIKLLILFDNPKFNITDKNKFDLFCKLITNFHFFGDNNDNIQPFFDDFLFIKWKNVNNQKTLIELMITNKEISENSKFALSNYQGEKISKDIELKSYINTKQHYLIENWRIIKLVETLIIISKDFDNYTEIKTIFEWAIRNIPEIIITSLLIIKIDFTKNSLMNDLIIEILSSILFDKNPQIKFINELWQINKDIIIYVLYNSWKNYHDLMNLSVIFDLANNIIKDSLLHLVKSKYHNFSVHLGLLASKRDYLHIEKWLKTNINEYGDEFINSLLDYLKSNVIQPCQMNNNKSGFSFNEINKANILEKAQLSLESLSIILNTLNSYTYNEINDNRSTNISLKTKKEITEINRIIFDIYDEIQDQQINSKEIEEEVNQLLVSMFEKKLKVDYIINLLLVYKSSNDKKKIELCSCLIYQIIDEYKNFNKYPKDKLILVSELFGKIINNKLLEGIIETLALNYISDSIKSNSEQLYFFGINALYQIIGNISCWPKYIKILLDIDKIKQNKNLYMIILREKEKIEKRFISEKTENPEIHNGIVPLPKGENKSSDLELEDFDKILNINQITFTNDNSNDIKEKENESSTNESIDKIIHTISLSPKNHISDEINKTNNNNNKILFNDSFENNQGLLEKIIYNSKILLDNNNSSDIKHKASEINIFLNNNEINIQIFSYIFITTKITQKNNLSYFNELFTVVNNSSLYKYILKYTIRYIQALLKINSLYIEENAFNTLKNLGTWLGLITILKNKPILARDIDFKELIIDSYINGKLLIVIPFTCKVFSFISKSKIFTINNPWINSILCLLKEIYFMHSLNNSIKKEIQNFFELVKIDINSSKLNIQYLNKKDRVEKEDTKLDFPDWQKLHLNIDKKKLKEKIRSLKSFVANLLNILNKDRNIFSNYHIVRNLKIFDRPIMNKINEIIFEENEKDKNNMEENDMVIFLTNLLYQSILDTLPKNMDIYFNRPILSVLAIVNQDFYYELDIDKYKTAINNMIKSFLNSFSMIGFHDYLKRNIGINLDICVKSHNVSKETMIFIRELPNSEYINVGLEEILEYITREAQNKLNSNDEFRSELERRNNINSSKIKHIGFANDKNIEIKKREIIPDKLKPNKNGLKPDEFEIYKKFQIENNNLLKVYKQDGKMSSFLNKVYNLLKKVMDENSMKVSKFENYESCLEKITTDCYSLDLGTNCLDEEQQTSLTFIKKIICDSKINKVDAINKMAMKTLDFIMQAAKMNNTLLLYIFIYILRGWYKLNNDVGNQITKRLFENDFNFDVDIFTLFKLELHQYLFKQKLINLDLYENYMFKLLHGTSVINTTVHHLLKNILSSNNNVINYGENKNSLKKLSAFIFSKNTNNNYYLLFNQKTSILMNMAKNYNLTYKRDNDINIKSILNNDITDTKSKKDLYFFYICYFKNKTTSGNNLIFQNEKKFNEENKFEEDLIENNIFNCVKQICEICMNNIFDSQFIKYSPLFYPEKLSIFIFYLINYKNISFAGILDIIIQCFHTDYLNNPKNFYQSKYYKFFINLINLITDPNLNDATLNQEKINNNLILICDTLKILSPKNYPGFTLGWLDLISYHHFINNFLDENLKKENSFKYEKYLSLLIELLSYLNQIKTKIINHFNFKFILDEIYKFLFLLCHTYPSFIASYYYLLISCLSLSVNKNDKEANLFIQLKNIILSTTPTDKNFFKENFLTKNILEENLISNKIIYLLTGSLDNEKQNKDDMQLKILVDKYIKGKKDEYILDEIIEILDRIKNEKELNTVYNGLAIYMLQYQIINQKNNNKSYKEAFYNFYLFLLKNLTDVNNKYLIDSILNCLRFPCPQTIDFSSLFQELLINIEIESIEKQLIINFLERFLYDDPIPWGIRYTFKCLIKNEKFEIMEKKYLKGNEVIENYLEKIHAQIRADELNKNF